MYRSAYVGFMGAAKIDIKDIFTIVTVTEKWKKLKTTGDVPPSLEEHTMVSYGSKIYVFGGISRMSVDGDTPLWILDTCV